MLNKHGRSAQAVVLLELLLNVACTMNQSMITFQKKGTARAQACVRRLF
eukprot:SAG31_NODE_239_length_19453_cov_5.539888_7_plen_49_part_00